MSKIIILCGKKRVGKDTVGNYLNKNYNYRRVAFAEPIKNITEKLIKLFIPKEDMSKYKSKKSKRHFYQQIGDILREEDEDIFVKLAVAKRVNNISIFNIFDNIVITDSRYQNEQDTIKMMFPRAKIFIIKIIRNAVEDDDETHKSEKIDMNCDLIVYNNSTLSKLYLTVDKIIDRHKLK